MPDPNLNTASFKPVIGYNASGRQHVTAPVTRPLGDQLGDFGINVITFGADPSGGTDSTAAIQAAIDYQTANSNRGVVLFPAGVYIVSSSIILNHGTGGSQNALILRGMGNNISTFNGVSAIIGNFADYLFKFEDPNGSSCVMFEDLYLQNSNNGGGCVFTFNNTSFLYRCGIGAMYGICFEGMNAPHGARDCFFQTSGWPTGGFGIALNGVGGSVIGCTFQGWNDAIRFHGDGCAVYSCRIEVSRIGIAAGRSGINQKIISTADNGSGKTRCTVTSTTNINTVQKMTAHIADPGGGLTAVDMSTAVVIDQTHFDLPAIVYSGSSITTATVMSNNENCAGFIISGCTFEADAMGIYLNAGPGLIAGNRFLGTPQTGTIPGDVSQYFIYGVNSPGVTIQNCTGGAVCVGGGVIANDCSYMKIDNCSFVCSLLCGGNYSAGATTIALDYKTTGFTNPTSTWLGAGLIISGGSAFAANTVVTGFPTSTSVSFSPALTGSIAFGTNIYFTDPNSGANSGANWAAFPGINTGLEASIWKIAVNYTIASFRTPFEVWVDPAANGGTLALKICGDGGWNDPVSLGTPPVNATYRITQLTAGTVNLSGETTYGGTVNGSTTTAFVVGGQYKTAFLRRLSANTWIAYNG